MNEASTPWMDGWLQAQQGYWKAWTELAQKSVVGQSAQPSVAWADGLSQWWKTVAPMTPPTGQDLFGKLVEMGKGYFSLAEGFSGNRANETSLDALNSWIDTLQKNLTDWCQGLNTRRDPQLQSFMNFWDLPMDTWQRLAANMVPMPGDFTQALHPEGATESLEQFRGHVGRFLSIPAVGYTRESQEQYQQLAQLMMDYNAALQAYRLAFGKLAVTSLQEFQRSLPELARDDKKLESVRAVYDHWVDICERVYARYVMSADYQTVYGALVNKLMLLKQQMARMVDQGLEAMNMPTRAEINTLQRRQQESRRDNQQLRHELRALRKQLDARSTTQPAAPVADTVAPKLESLPDTTEQAPPAPSNAPVASTKTRAPKAPAKPKAAKKTKGGNAA
ncbi:MAG: class III poly(R)-hydroxyalkanoic acid synthase subunit PhaE [Thiotrichales bacterium]